MRPLCASLTTALVFSQLGRPTGRFSEKTLLRSALLPYAAGLMLVAVTPTLLLIPLVLFGVARGINLPAVFSS